MSLRSAIHESAHAAILLHYGFCPTRIVIDGDSGKCGLPHLGDAENVRAVVSVAGIVAEGELSTVDSSRLSEKDAALLQDAADASGRDVAELRAWATSEALALVRQHAATIRRIADALDAERALTPKRLKQLWSE